MFRDRIDAGGRLAAALQEYKNQNDVIVVGLPRGGVPVAYQIAKSLNLPLDIVCPRKIGAPMNPEFAIGAITETGSSLFDEEVILHLGISKKYLEQEVEKQKGIAKRRIEMYRKGRLPREFGKKTIILVDDGLATGATMKAVIQFLREERVGGIVVAVPVSPSETLEEIRRLVDFLICLEVPASFQAVGQFYESFDQTEDEEVVSLMQRFP